tara:strand:+ start:475 stop:777 length:303 start_codon:yes stop_codon:yes gene_type:complete
MSLIKCSECGKEISDKATTCPNCGCPTVAFEKAKKIKEGNREQVVAGLLVGAVVIGLFGAVGYQSFCDSDRSLGEKAMEWDGKQYYFRKKYMGQWSCPRN